MEFQPSLYLPKLKLTPDRGFPSFFLIFGLRAPWKVGDVAHDVDDVAHLRDVAHDVDEMET